MLTFNIIDDLTLMVAVPRKAPGSASIYSGARSKITDSVKLNIS